MQLVNSYQDCVKYDGKIAIVSGKYNAIARPIKGSVQVDTEKNMQSLFCLMRHVFF